MTCGSIIPCTPMKLGPTTFQCTCFSVRCRSLYVLSCFCRSLATSLPWRALRPGMVNCGITNSFGYAGYVRYAYPELVAAIHDAHVRVGNHAESAAALATPSSARDRT